MKSLLYHSKGILGLLTISRNVATARFRYVAGVLEVRPAAFGRLGTEAILIRVRRRCERDQGCAEKPEELRGRRQQNRECVWESRES